MHKILLLTITLFGFSSCFSQESIPISEKYTAHNKGKVYIFWGGNRENYTNSDIHFKGNTYEFTLYDVAAVDKPKGWHTDYLNPSRMTIPKLILELAISLMTIIIFLSVWII
jgi:hypothetical protein